MRSRYRLLVVSDSDGIVREFTVGRTALWGFGVGSLAVLVAGPLAGLVIASRAPPRECAQASVAAAPPNNVVAGALEPAASTPPARSPGRPCPENMVLVDGEFCPEVFHRCLEYMDAEGTALHRVRCARYKEPAHCLSPQRVHLRYCVDRNEYVAPGQTLPRNQTTFAEAREICRGQGKRLCTETEWTFACEGEAMRPYAYGFVRDRTLCNTDRADLVRADGELRDRRAEPGAFPRCTSPFGVTDMTGNLEEYVMADDAADRPIRKGAYWQPGANQCRASQPEPDPDYRSVEVGFRCCADPAAAPGAAPDPS